MSNLGQKKIIYYISENALTSLNETNGLRTLKNEIISFLKEKRYNRIDFKSVGALFGLGYYSDNIHMVDILVHFEYDFYKIRQFLSDFLSYICERKILTTKDKRDIVEFYSGSNNHMDITIFMNKYNDMYKFKVFKDKIWTPLSMSIFPITTTPIIPPPPPIFVDDETSGGSGVLVDSNDNNNNTPVKRWSEL